jgi:enoyl-CoA hydratase/carnithine racemase
MARLTAAVGRGQAARLTFSAGGIDAKEALRIGLVELESGSALHAADLLAAEIVANSPRSISLLKAMLNADGRSGSMDFDQAFDEVLGEASFIERLATFQARRRRTT